MIKEILWALGFMLPLVYLMDRGNAVAFVLFIYAYLKFYNDNHKEIEE